MSTISSKARRESFASSIARLKAGNVILGPALIEEATTTTVVRHHHTCAVDNVGNLIITRR